MHHLRKNQYPSAPKRSHQKVPPTTDVPRNNQLTIRKALIPTARPQTLPVGSEPGFRFLDLSPELRNLVCSFCLPDEEYTIFQTRFCSRKLKSNSAKGLIAVCTQIRNEFRLLYWSVHGPVIQRYELSNLMDVFFFEKSNDNVMPPRVTLVYYDHIPGSAKMPDDIAYDLSPLVKSPKCMAGRKPEWQFLPKGIPDAFLAAVPAWPSHRPGELANCLSAITEFDWNGLLAKM